jgi:hypothetical protein
MDRCLTAAVVRPLPRIHAHPAFHASDDVADPAGAHSGVLPLPREHRGANLSPVFVGRPDDHVTISALRYFKILASPITGFSKAL